MCHVTSFYMTPTKMSKMKNTTSNVGEDVKKLEL